jgi:putative endonuclease
MFYVYVLKSRKDQKYYIGQTANISARLLCHNRGDVKSTRKRRPMDIVFYENYETRAGAMKRESQIKRMKCGTEFRKILSEKSKVVRHPACGTSEAVDDFQRCIIFEI